MHWDVENPHDRAVLQVARSWGVSPSKFMGEPKPSSIQKTATGDYVLKESPEWTDDDRTAALELIVYESKLCSGCGHPLDETTKAENEFAYSAEAPIRCHRCTAAEIAQDKIESAKYPHSSALMVPIVLREKSSAGISEG